MTLPTGGTLRDKWPLLMLLTIGLFATSSWAEETSGSPVEAHPDEQLKVNFAVFDYPPLYHSTSDGGFSGILGETFKVLCERAKLSCNFQMLPVSRAYRSLMIGNSDVLISGKHPKFQKCCGASEWSYPWTSGIYSKRPLSDIPNSKEALVGRSLIVLRGWIAPYVFEPQLNELAADGQLALFQATSNHSAIRMLESDRAEFLYGATEFQWYFKKMGLTETLNFKHIRTMPLVLWVSNRRNDILSRLNYAFRALREERLLNDHNVLKEKALSTRYIDAPFSESLLH